MDKNFIKRWLHNEIAVLAVAALWTSLSLVVYGVLFERHSYKPEMLISGLAVAAILFLLGLAHPGLYIVGALAIGVPSVVYAHTAHYWHIGNLALRVETALDSPSGEMREFVMEFIVRAKFAWALGFYLLVALGLGVWAWLLHKRGKRRLNWRFAAALALAAVVGFGARGQVSAYPAAELASTAYKVYKRLNPVLIRNRNVDRFMKHATPLQCNGRFTKVVYVQGESENRDFMHAYGYPLPTTPFLDNLKGHVQVWAISPANQTILSMPILLTSATVENRDLFYTNPSIISDLKRCGYQTFWISNQEPAGKHADAVSSIAREADVVRFVMKIEPGRVPDGHIFKIFSQKDIVPGRKQAFFFHLMGSHYEWKLRYPPDWALIKNPKNRLEEYVNTVYYTDHILQRIFETFRADGDSLLFIYTSDHGELVTPKGGGHGNAHPFQDEYRIPLVFWASDPDTLQPIAKATQGRLVNAENLDHQIRFLLGLENEPGISYGYKVITPGVPTIVDYRSLPYHDHPDKP